MPTVETGVQANATFVIIYLKRIAYAYTNSHILVIYIFWIPLQKVEWKMHTNNLILYKSLLHYTKKHIGTIA